MSVKVTISLDTASISKLEGASKQSFEMTVEAVKTDIKDSQVVPKDTGTLEDSAYTLIKDNIGAVIFDTAYARRLYWHPEYNFRHDKNPNAQGLWMEDYLTGDKKKWIIETYGKFLKQLSGGLIR